MRASADRVEAPDQLGPRAHAELGVDAAEVVLDGLRAHDELRRCLPVREAACDELRDGLLLRREVGPPRGPARRAGRSPDAAISCSTCSIHGRAPRQPEPVQRRLEDAHRPASLAAAAPRPAHRELQSGSGVGPDRRRGRAPGPRRGGSIDLGIVASGRPPATTAARAASVATSGVDRVAPRAPPTTSSASASPALGHERLDEARPPRCDPLVDMPTGVARRSAGPERDHGDRWSRSHAATSSAATCASTIPTPAPTVAAAAVGPLEVLVGRLAPSAERAGGRGVGQGRHPVLPAVVDQRGRELGEEDRRRPTGPAGSGPRPGRSGRSPARRTHSARAARGQARLEVGCGSVQLVGPEAQQTSGAVAVDRGRVRRRPSSVGAVAQPVELQQAVLERPPQGVAARQHVGGAGQRRLLGRELHREPAPADGLLAPAAIDARRWPASRRPGRRPRAAVGPRSSGTHGSSPPVRRRQASASSGGASRRGPITYAARPRL